MPQVLHTWHRAPASSRLPSLPASPERPATGAVERRNQLPHCVSRLLNLPDTRSAYRALPQICVPSPTPVLHLASVTRCCVAAAAWRSWWAGNRSAQFVPSRRTLGAMCTFGHKVVTGHSSDQDARGRKCRPHAARGVPWFCPLYPACPCPAWAARRLSLMLAHRVLRFQKTKQHPVAQHKTGVTPLCLHTQQSCDTNARSLADRRAPRGAEHQSLSHLQVMFWGWT